MAAMGLRERKKAKTRSALVASARKFFRRHGFDGAPIDEIAADADVSVASLYNYFGSKDDLLAAIIVEDVLSGTAEAERTLLKGPNDPRLAYMKLIKIYFRCFDAIDRALLRRFTGHAIAHEYRADEDYFDLESRLLRQIGEMTKRLQSAGALAPNIPAELLSRLVFSIANSEFYGYVAADGVTSQAAVSNVEKQLALMLRHLQTEMRRNGS